MTMEAGFWLLWVMTGVNAAICWLVCKFHSGRYGWSMYFALKSMRIASFLFAITVGVSVYWGLETLSVPTFWHALLSGLVFTVGGVASVHFNRWWMPY